jgi:hypothetical protein
MGNAIEVSDLTKQYGIVTAVDGITLRVARGEFFAMESRFRYRFFGPDKILRVCVLQSSTLFSPDRREASPTFRSVLALCEGRVKGYRETIRGASRLRVELDVMRW